MTERRPLAIGPRGAVLLAIALTGLVAALALDLAPGDLAPNPGGLELCARFLAAALQPALDHQGDFFVEQSFLLKVLEATGHTLLFALAAMSLSLLIGLPLGVLASDVWWRPEAFGGGRLQRVARPLLILVRVWIALMRSVHELLWAVILLAALGLNTFGAVVAIAIPYGGTLAKVFSEMLDEAPRNTVEALHGLGAPPLRAFLYGLLPRAFPDLVAYSFYRFECSVRASAVLGFFGYPTLGYHLRLAFEDTHYREVWTYLYALLLLVLLLEGWSAAVRRRLSV